MNFLCPANLVQVLLSVFSKKSIVTIPSASLHTYGIGAEDGFVLGLLDGKDVGKDVGPQTPNSVLSPHPMLPL